MAGADGAAAAAAAFAAPGGEDGPRVISGAGPSAASLATADIEAELDRKTELTPEEWVKATIDIRDVTETKAFGRSVVKVYFNMYVNGEFYRGYRYSEIHKLRGNLKKIDEAHMKKAPKYPEKSRVSFGAASPEQVEQRRKLFGPWLDHVAKSLKIASSEEWKTFTLNQPDYKEIEAEMLQKVGDIEKISEDQWTETANKKGVKVSTLKQPDSKLHVVKTFVTVQVPLAKVLETYNTKAEWTHWQPDMKVCKTIELLEGVSELAMPVKEVLYAAYRVPVLSNRDVCLYGYRFMGTPADRNAPGVSTSLSMSMMHPSCPHVKNIVRGYLNIGVTYFREIDGGKGTSVTSVLHMDPRGLIPPSLINTMAAHTVGTIVDMKDYMEKKYCAA
eukprot:CAMPEP_0182915828 /NCGR_PEP_ID=MMETSP0105_2-20130417/560_1 /TAXON_ID=81532 ORGANISM="Acanthoeca-like sp., Strain 10tr" /NCGR_SAMPLE_ID=MMETSP0105_2 /ASSEMBLY_ACC=CAM_ASM_000205 /LENGTH=387 /DNA_ID=CAMNT_0025052719 /DNA_START=29 /DNA_END=1192 /DNA_ORIENTATION=+